MPPKVKKEQPKKEIDVSKLPCKNCKWRYSTHCPKCKWNQKGDVKVY